MTEPYQYQGQELSVFEKAKNWKKYFSTLIRPYIKGAVLDAGAGLGVNTVLLDNGNVNEWLLLEPDKSMSEHLMNKVKDKELPPSCSVLNGTTEDISPDQKFDTILYIDVLEHIKLDFVEMKRAADLLKEGGHLVILSPALQSLYSSFDKALGHYRRYSAKKLKQISPESLKVIKLSYLDSMGFFVSLANKIFLKKSFTTEKQLLVWDRCLIPVSKMTDKILFHSFGKSILGIWQKRTGKQLNPKFEP